MSDSDLMCKVEAGQLRATPSSDANTLVDNRDVEQFFKGQNNGHQGGEKVLGEFGMCTIDGLEPAAPKLKLDDTTVIGPVEMPTIKGGGFTTDFGDGQKVAVGPVEMPAVAGDGYAMDFGDGTRVTVRPVEMPNVGIPVKLHDGTVMKIGPVEMPTPGDLTREPSLGRTADTFDLGVVVDKDGRVTKSTSLDGRSREFEYDAGKLSAIKSDFSGNTWTRVNDSWIRDDGKVWKGTFTVDGHGDLIFQPEQGRAFRFTREGNTERLSKEERAILRLEKGDEPPVRTDAKGNQITEYPNGNRDIVTPAGTIINETPNGVIKRTTTFADGTKVVEYAGGETDTIGADGTQTQQSADGRRAVVTKDGTAYSEYDFSNKTVFAAIRERSRLIVQAVNARDGVAPRSPAPIKAAPSRKTA